MIKMTYMEARAISRNRELVTSLITAPLSIKVGYNLRKIFDKVGAAAQEYDLFEANLQKDVASRFGQKDEKGEFVFEASPQADGTEGEKTLQFSDENRAAANKEMYLGITEFGKREFTIDRNPVDLSEEKVQIRMVDLPLIEKIIVDLEPSEPVSEGSSGTQH